MTEADGDWAGYRHGVGILLLDRDRRVFVGRRINMPMGLAAWQMPQGGIDPGETPHQAAMRELHEETGTDKAALLGESRVWLHYDLPPEIAGGMWGGKYRGQRQKWFAMRFLGQDRDIDLAAHKHPEFDAWEWVAPAR
jgi:putative (di)nucleoside polyphosphate hydrolase